MSQAGFSGVLESEVAVSTFVTYTLIIKYFGRLTVCPDMVVVLRCLAQFVSDFPIFSHTQSAALPSILQFAVGSSPSRLVRELNVTSSEVFAVKFAFFELIICKKIEFISRSKLYFPLIK